MATDPVFRATPIVKTGKMQVIGKLLGCSVAGRGAAMWYDDSFYIIFP